MPSVTSWFLGQALRPGGTELMRQALIVTSDGDTWDVSGRVLRWPTIKQTTGRFQATKLNVTLAAVQDASEDHPFLRFDFDTNSMMVAYEKGTRLKLSMGYVHPFSGPELVTMFDGRIEATKWRRGTVGLRLRGADLRLEDMQLGNVHSPMYVGSAVQSSTWISPHSVAWIACSSAGLDVTTDSTNEDINWDKWYTWRETFSDNAIHFQKHSCVAAFTGQKVGAVLNEIARQTHSLIGVDINGKVVVARRNAANTAGSPVFDSLKHLMDLEYNIGRDRGAQHVTVMNNYNVGSVKWANAPYEVYNAHIGYTWGYRHERWESTKFWYQVQSAARFNAYQLIGYSSTSMPADQKQYFPSARVTMPFIGSYLEITDSFRMVDSWAGVSSGTEWYITSKGTSMETGKVVFDVEKRQEVRDPAAGGGK